MSALPRHQAPAKPDGRWVWHDMSWKCLYRVPGDRLGTRLPISQERPWQTHSLPVSARLWHTLLDHTCGFTPLRVTYALLKRKNMSTLSVKRVYPDVTNSEHVPKCIPGSPSTFLTWGQRSYKLCCTRRSESLGTRLFDINTQRFGIYWLKVLIKVVLC